MALSLLPRAAENVSPRPIDQQAVEDALHSGELRRNLLAEIRVLSERLWLHSPHDLLGLAHKHVELLAGADIEVAEPLEERSQVFDGRIAEDFRLAILVTAQALGQVADQPRQLVGKCLLGQLHRFFEPGRYALRFLGVELRAELPQVLGWLDRWKVVAGFKQPGERCRIIGAVIQSPQPLAGSRLELLVLVAERLDGIGQFRLRVVSWTPKAGMSSWWIRRIPGLG
jgi:hypothetical protein